MSGLGYKINEKMMSLIEQNIGRNLNTLYNDYNKINNNFIIIEFIIVMVKKQNQSLPKQTHPKPPTDILPPVEVQTEDHKQ